MLDVLALSEATYAIHQTKPEEDKLYRYDKSCMIRSGYEYISVLNAGLVWDERRQYTECVTSNKIMQHIEPHAARYHTDANQTLDGMSPVHHTRDDTTGGILITYNDTQD